MQPGDNPFLYGVSVCGAFFLLLSSGFNFLGAIADAKGWRKHGPADLRARSPIVKTAHVVLGTSGLLFGVADILWAISQTGFLEALSGYCKNLAVFSLITLNSVVFYTTLELSFKSADLVIPAWSRWVLVASWLPFWLVLPTCLGLGLSLNLSMFHSIFNSYMAANSGIILLAMTSCAAWLLVLLRERDRVLSQLGVKSTHGGAVGTFMKGPLRTIALLILTLLMTGMLYAQVSGITDGPFRRNAPEPLDSDFATTLAVREVIIVVLQWVLSIWFFLPITFHPKKVLHSNERHAGGRGSKSLNSRFNRNSHTKRSTDARQSGSTRPDANSTTEPSAITLSTSHAVFGLGV